jgi:hypothetical protein
MEDAADTRTSTTSARTSRAFLIWSGQSDLSLCMNHQVPVGLSGAGQLYVSRLSQRYATGFQVLRLCRSTIIILDLTGTASLNDGLINQ